MATTGAVIQFLLAGAVNPNNGSAIASGKARFYQPGTLVARDVFTDDACSSALSQPGTLGSGGEAKWFMLEPVRCIIKDSTDTTTLIDTVILQRHDHQYITHASWNSGAETTLENILGSIGTNIGVDGQYKHSSTATARTYQSWLAEDHISVKDYGATGDGSTDDTAAIQATVVAAKDAGGAWVFFPKGTYKITSAIVIGTTSSYRGVCFRGVGPGTSVIKNFSTSASAINIDIVGGERTNCIIRDLSITANSSSSGSAIILNSGWGVRIENVWVGLHRQGLHAASADTYYSLIRDCKVVSTDDNVNARAIYLGPYATLTGTESRTGAGYSVDCTLGGGSVITGNQIVGGTGLYIPAGQTSITVVGNLISAATAVDVRSSSNVIVGNRLDGSTGTDLNVTVDAQGSIISGNVYTNNGATIVADATLQSGVEARSFQKLTTSSTGTADTFTPTPISPGQQVHTHVYSNSSADAVALTVAATATTSLMDGQPFKIILYKNNAANDLTPTWNAQYIGASAAAIGPGDYTVFDFTWIAGAAKWTCVNQLNFNTTTAGLWGIT